MAVAFESAGTVAWGAAANNNGHAPALPATRPTGSVLLLVAWTRLITATLATPSGWTLLSPFPKTSGTTAGGRMWIFARVVDGTEDAPTLSWTGPVTGTSGDIIGAYQICYSGADTASTFANLLDGTVTVTDASGTTTCTYPAITIANATSRVVHTLCRFRDAVDTFTPSTGTPTVTERVDSGTTNRTGGQVHAQDFAPTSSGSQASRTVAPSNTTASRYLAVSLALKELPAPKTTATGRVSLASASTPATQTLHKLHVRARVTSAVTGTMFLRLYEGATARSAELETSALTTSLADYTVDVADADAAGITSYSDLEVEFRGYSSAGDAAVFEVAELWLEIPAAATGGGSQALDGTSAGTSTSTGSLSVARPLTGTSAGTSATSAATVNVARPLTGSSAGTSTTTAGDLAVLRPLDGTSAGTSATTGELTVEGGGVVALSGTSTGTSTTTGELAVVASLTATSAGTSTTVGALAVNASLAGTSAGASTTTGNLRAAFALTGASAGNSTTAGELSVAEPGITELTGTSAGTSTTAGSLRVAYGLTGTSAGQGTTVGALRLDWALTGVSTGSSGTTAALSVSGPIEPVGLMEATGSVRVVEGRTGTVVLEGTSRVTTGSE